MSKKIFALLFFLLVLMSISSVSAADLDDNNGTVALSYDVEILFAENDVDAIGDLNENDADGGDKALQNDAKSVEVGEDNEIYSVGYAEAEEDSMSQVLGEPSIGSITVEGSIFYVNASAAPNGDGSEAAPFKTLKDALNVTEDGDIIIIASGTYSGTNNTGLTIDKRLSFEKYGDGEAIFDGQGLNRIWTLNSQTININGLTLKNGKSASGGAIFIQDSLYNSIINITFINNRADTSYGGAIYVHDEISNSRIYGEFINNSAAEYGGAIYISNNLSNSNINAIFINNTALHGGANCFNNNLTNVNITGNFINNSAWGDSHGGANYFGGALTDVNIIGNYSGNTAHNDGGANSFEKELGNVNIIGNYSGNTAHNDGGANIFKKNITNVNIIGNYVGNNATNGGANDFKDKLTNVNITGNFINNSVLGGGYAGANYFGGALTDVNIIGNYSGNTAHNDGGANSFEEELGNVDIIGNYIGNAALYDGGANIFKKNITNVNIIGDYVGNNATNGGANDFRDKLTDVNIMGRYVNNTGKNVIHIFESVSNNVIHDSIFLNNNVSNSIYVENGAVRAVDNWFGNNATNYDEAPANEGIEFDNWLFLNATASTSEMVIGESSTIAFNLYSKSFPEEVYDASKMNIILDLAQTRGKLDKTAVSLGEEIAYTARNEGDAGVTGKFETASYTISLKNKISPIYVNASAKQGGDGSLAKPFKTLKEALDAADDNSTIMIAAGTYTGNNNSVGLKITKNNLTFNKYGDGEAIFDAQGLDRIWTVAIGEYSLSPITININGLTFKNANARASERNYGGAIYFHSKVTDSNINANFINNTALHGGAIEFHYGIESSFVTGVFINNTATGGDDSKGGAIYAELTGVANSVISGIYIGNKAQGSDARGSAIYIAEPSFNVNISGRYINNTEKSVIQLNSPWYTPSQNIFIHDAIFLNNYNNNEINAGFNTTINVKDCWFGNNATNYDEKPDIGIDLNGWLFLNATADPSKIEVGKTSTIAFKLYNKNSPDVEYDASKMNIELDLAQTLGELDKSTALIGEEISYTAKEYGDAGVTGKFETASYTISLINWITGAIYVNATADQDGDGSIARPFKTLKDAMDAAEDGDMIMIASGTYTGTNNTGLTIDKKLSFEKYGYGEAIFDAQGLDRIWTVNAATININGLTFKNGNSRSDGGAIYIGNALSDSTITATFINNTAKSNGGAVYFGEVSNSTIDATFIDNNATGSGGAICIYKNADNVNVSGVFKNNTAKHAGAIYFTYIGTLSNSNIDAAFINNTASDEGGANYFNNVTNVNITGDFINNTAKGSDALCGGGANYFKGILTDVSICGNFIGNTALGSGYMNGGAANFFLEDVANLYLAGNFIDNKASNCSANLFLKDVLSDSIINATFVNNTASHDGAAIFIYGALEDSSIMGTFVNNTGDSVIYMRSYVPYSGFEYGGIHDSILINNDVDKIINVHDGTVRAVDNWFGNSAANYNETPANAGIDLDNWLFLNATADPDDIGIGQNSTIAFNLYYKNSPEEVYDASKMNIKLDLTQTLGELDKTAASLGEEITYTAKDNGHASVTGKFETASYTISLNSRIPTELDLNLKVPAEYSQWDSVVITGDVFVSGTKEKVKKGSVDIYINDEFAQTIEVDEEWEIDRDLGVSDAGNYTIAAVYHDDSGEFMGCEWNSSFEIGQATTEITVNASIELIIGNSTNIGAVLSPSEAGNLSYSSNDTEVASVDEYGDVVGVAAGTATITVSFEGSKNYATATQTVTVTVDRFDSILSSNDVSTIYNVSSRLYATLTDADGNAIVGAKVNLVLGCINKTVKTDSKGRVSASTKNLDVGEYTAVVTFAGDKVYAPSKTSAKVLVKTGTELTANDVSAVYNVSSRLYATLTGADGKPIVGAKVNMVLGSINKTVKTDSKGRVSASTKYLDVGDYTAVVTFAGNSVYAPSKTTAHVFVRNISVLSAKDVSAVYNVSSRLYATLTGADGKPIVGAKVNMVLGNINKTVKTDSKGRISASTKNLDVGEYTAAITFAGNSVYAPSKTTAKVLVKIGTELTAKDIVAEYNVSSRLYATLKDTDGNIITGAKVNVVLGNINKTLKTDSKGRVSVSTVSLTPGNYTARISYAGDDTYYKSSTTSKVVVNKIPITLTAKDMVAKQGSSTRFYVTLKDADGNPLTGVKVHLVLGDIDKTVKTDARGRISASLKNLAAGNYTAMVSCDGTEIYGASSTTASVVIR
ncbi:Ig-like domain-containing protein [Methanobrevibacter sp.]|uniref:Ig-like domain-containing protein n=1 Tax=Methanobrevibacter sp. TaxID=66852 RepID=UPI00389073AD